MPPPPRTSIVGSLCACISRSARRAASSPSRLADLADLASSVATPRAPASSPDRARSPEVRHTPRANSRATCAGDARTPGGATRASDALARATASRAACHCAGDCRSRAAVSGDTARGTCCARDSGTPRAIHDAAADAASDPVVARDATRRIIASQPGAEGTAAGGGGGISISRHVHVSSCVNQDRGSPRGAPVQVRYAGCARGDTRTAAGSLEVVSRRLPRRRTGSAAEPGRRDRYPGKDPEATNRRILMSRRGRWRFSYAFSV